MQCCRVLQWFPLDCSSPNIANSVHRGKHHLQGCTCLACIRILHQRGTLDRSSIERYTIPDTKSKILCRLITEKTMRAGCNSVASTITSEPPHRTKRTTDFLTPPIMSNIRVSNLPVGYKAHGRRSKVKRLIAVTQHPI